MLQVLDVSQFLINRVYYAVAWSWLLWATSAQQLNEELVDLALQPRDELLLCGFSVVFSLLLPLSLSFAHLFFVVLFFRLSCLTSKVRTCLRMEG